MQLGSLEVHMLLFEASLTVAYYILCENEQGTIVDFSILHTRTFFRKPRCPFKALLFALGIRCERMLQGQDWVFVIGWLLWSKEVNVTSFAALRIHSPNSPCNCVPPITTLSHILIISKPKHQLVTYFSILCYSKSPFGHTLAEAKVGKGRGHNMESWVISTLLS